MPPYNATDPSATFLSASCLDLLLIELVPLAYRVTSERDAAAPSGPDGRRSSPGRAAVGSGATPRKVDEDEEFDAVHFRLESLGYRVGQGLVERCVRPVSPLSSPSPSGLIVGPCLADSPEIDPGSTIRSISSSFSAKTCGR